MEVHALSLEEVLGRARADRKPKPRPLHEAQIMEIAALFTRHQRQPFTAGEFVTPVENSGHEWVGEPHIVMQTKEPYYDFGPNMSPGSPAYGHRVDMEVAVMSTDYLCTYWVDSRCFVKYSKKQEQ